MISKSVRKYTHALTRTRTALLRELRAQRQRCGHARAYRAVDSLYDPYEEAHVYCPSCEWHWYSAGEAKIEVGDIEFRDRVTKREVVPRPQR